MKVKKLVEFQQEIEVHVSIDDLILALHDYGDNDFGTKSLLGNVSLVLRALPQERIDNLNDNVKEVVHTFLTKQAIRFSPVFNSKCHPKCPGWGIFNGNEIQRCDKCNRFKTDADAVNHFAMIAWQGEQDDCDSSGRKAGVPHEEKEAGEESLLQEQRQGEAGPGQVGDVDSETAP